MRLPTSLGARLLAATLTTAAVTLAALVGIVLVGGSQNLREQTLEVSRWSEAQLSDRLLSDARLAAARVQLLREDVGRRFSSVAQRSDLGEAVLSGHTVLVAELLRPALETADLDGAIAFDAKLRPLGADRVNADLLAANRSVQASPLAESLRDLLARSDRDNPHGFLKSVPLDPGLALALAAKASGPAIDLFGRPLFDEFGDVAGVIVGYRILRPREPALAIFAALSGRDIVIRQGDKAISTAGRSLPDPDLQTRPGSELKTFNAGRDVARCQPLDPGAEICAVAPASELDQLARNVLDIGERHSYSLLSTLSFAALAALILFALVSLVLSRRITQPLVRITETVGEVARGNWQTHVLDVDRSDEVGNIARAVVLLEHSLEEHDQLREDVLSQNGRLLEREEELRGQNDRFDAALNNMSQGLCMFDADGCLKVFNAQLLTIYRLAPGRIRLGAHAESVRAMLGAATARDEAVSEAATLSPTIASAGTETLKLADGRLIELSVQPMATGGWVETHEDVTETRSIHARMSYMAMHDALTDLPNRVLFLNRLAGAFAERDRSGRAVAVLCLDLDDFKTVNDTLGHAAGDELLRKASARLLAALPATASVARLGGDEFAILELGAEQPASAVALAGKLVAILKQPYLIQGQVVAANASIGVAAASPDTEDFDHLLRRADLALYAAKMDGRARYRVFETAMEERIQQRRWLERDLRHALKDGRIEIHYQPLFNMETNTISGFEALARWNHPVRGHVSPGDFIPLAESVGLIDALGEYVLWRACAEAVTWPGHIKVAVNVSPVQFRNPDLCRTVATVLARTGLASSRLELEITESVVLHQDGATHDALHKLRALGVRFSMDDFGTGYSSLSSLNSFPFDKIKLDQSFVRDAKNRDGSAAIIRIVADLGRSLKMSTTAEGVETSQQLESLRRSGFSEAQGFLFSPAVPARDVAALISRCDRLRSAA